MASSSVQATNGSVTGNGESASGSGPQGPDDRETSRVRGEAHAHSSVAARAASSTESAGVVVQRRVAAVTVAIARFGASFSGNQAPAPEVPRDGMMAELDQLLREAQSSQK